MHLFTLDLADTVFLACMLIGVVLLLLTVLLDDIFSGVFEAFDFDIGDGSALPVVLGFVAMFGAGGLIGTQTLGLSSAGASFLGVGAGVVGAGLVYLVYGMLKRMEAPGAFSRSDLIGHVGRVDLPIKANGDGSINISYSGLSHTFAATSAQDLPSGAVVTVTAVAGTTLVVSSPLPPQDNNVLEPTITEGS